MAHVRCSKMKGSVCIKTTVPQKFVSHDMIKMVGRLYCHFNGNPYTNNVASSDVPSAANVLIHSGDMFFGVAATLMDGLLITHNIFTLWLEFG